MFTSPLISTIVMLSKQILRKDPGNIVGPIAKFLGYIIDALFNLVSQISISNSLGFSIILLTIATRFIMLPLAVGQQKSMSNMQKVQPLIEKIKKKYENKKDAESQQKMNAEIQKLYQEHKINPLMGCLPLLIQMPIFFALSDIMQRSYKYIGRIGDLYYKSQDSIANVIVGAKETLGVEKYVEILRPLTLPKIPENMMKLKEWDIAQPDIMAEFINRFSIADWNSLIAQMPEQTVNSLQTLLEQKNKIEVFFGIDLLQNAMELSGGFSNIFANMWPGVLIPIFAIITTYLSTLIMNKQSTSTDENAKMQQKMMLYVMPIVFGGMTATFPAGVGLYWITSTVFQIGQQFILHKYFFKDSKQPTKENTPITVKKK